MKNLLFFFLCALIFTSCKNYYTIDNFDQETKSHKRIAVLPFEILITGQVPANLTAADRDEIEIAESLLLQTSLYNNILKRTRNKRLNVKVQHFNKTLNILSANNIDIKSSWYMNAEELAKLLKVDAVVKAKVEQAQYFPDEVSIAIDVGTQILDIINPEIITPGGIENNKRVRATYALIDSKEGDVLWNIDYDQEADWQKSNEEIADIINRRSTRHFPYLTKN